MFLFFWDKKSFFLKVFFFEYAKFIAVDLEGPFSGVISHTNLLELATASQVAYFQLVGCACLIHANAFYGQTPLLNSFAELFCYGKLIPSRATSNVVRPDSLDLRMKQYHHMKLFTNTGCEVAGYFTCGSKPNAMKCFLLLWIVMVHLKIMKLLR